MAGQWQGEGRGNGGDRRDRSADQAWVPSSGSKSAKQRRERAGRMKAKAKARKTGVTGEEVPQPHEPELAVRPFSSVDFSQAVQVMPPEWFFAGMSEAETEAQAQMDFASTLAAANLALVATVDDGTDYDPVTVGLLLAKVPGLPPVAGTQAWLEAAADAEKVLRYGCPAARKAREYVSQLDERGRLLLEAAKAAGTTPKTDCELTLFCVAPDARGTGAGAALIAAFEQAARDAGQSGYWLQTDTACSWGWYDAHGFTRAAEVELDERFPMPPGDQDAPAARVFLYVKEL